MKAPIVLFALLLIHQNHLYTKAQPGGITCSDFKSMAFVGSVLVSFSSKLRNDVGVDFYLSTELKREHVKISSSDWSPLRDNFFDPTKKTYIIVHGYKSGGTKSWVLNLKNKILDAVSN